MSTRTFSITSRCFDDVIGTKQFVTIAYVVVLSRTINTIRNLKVFLTEREDLFIILSFMLCQLTYWLPELNCDQCNSTIITGVLWHPSDKRRTARDCIALIIQVCKLYYSSGGTEQGAGGGGGGGRKRGINPWGREF